MSFIYIASPYSDPDPAVMEYRFEQAEQTVAEMLIDGDAVYSPIVHCHELAKKYDLPRDFDFWMDYNLALLSKASQMLVLNLDGWEYSKGVAREIEFAQTIGLQIMMMWDDKP